MRRTLLTTAVAVLGTLAGLGPAEAQPPAADGASGGIQMTVHTHSRNDPNSADLLFPTDRLSFNFVQGEDFSYSSRPCGGRAPFNDLGLDFRPDYPGVDDDADGTAAVRHHVTGTVTEVNGDRGTIEGTITSVLCENGAETGNSIVFTYEARYVRVSDDEVRITGKWEISSGTGTFADMEGHGNIQGIFTCLGAATCAQLGYFTDFVGVRGDPTKGPGELQPGLVGTFRDPTVQPV